MVTGDKSGRPDEQLRMFPGEDPDELIERAVTEHTPIARWCLFSGGNDSTVLAHRCRESYDGLMWVDTGTAVPGVEEFIHEYTAWLGKPLRIMRAGDAYRTMVLGDDTWWSRYEETKRGLGVELSHEQMERIDRELYGQGSGGVRSGPHKGLDLGQYPHGFPGTGAHGRAYSRLKERQIEAFTAELKTEAHWSDRVLYLSGIRRAESRRRGRREPITRPSEKSAVYVNPLIDWSNGSMWDYRRTHELSQSPAARILHRSGECNCGAFAEAKYERAMMETFYHAWWLATIVPLEEEAERRGIRWCRWGGFDADGMRSTEETKEKPGLLCDDCPVLDGMGAGAAA